jgi:hypothetical protein
VDLSSDLTLNSQQLTTNLFAGRDISKILFPDNPVNVPVIK